MRYSEMTREELLNEMNSLEIKFKALKEKNLNLNMARGKPGKRQLDLVSGLLDVLVDPADCKLGNTDKKLWGDFRNAGGQKVFFRDSWG